MSTRYRNRIQIAIVMTFAALQLAALTGCKKNDSTSPVTSNPTPTPSPSASPSPSPSPSPTPSASPTPTSLAPTQAQISVTTGDLVSNVILPDLGMTATDVSGTFTWDTTHQAAVTTTPAATLVHVASASSGVQSMDYLGASPNRDATAPWSASIDMYLEFPNGATKACSVLAPYSSLTCNANQSTFSIASTDVTGGNLQVKAYAANGTADEYLNSNTLKTLRITTQKLTNTLMASNPSLFATSSHVFVASDTRPYRTNGTTLEQLTNITASGSGGDPVRYLATGADDTVYFFLNGTPVKLYAMNGTTIKQLTNDGNTAGNINFTSDTFPSSTWMGGKLYYLGRTTAGGLKLFRYDPAGTIEQLSDIRADNSKDDAYAGAKLVAFNNAVYFGGLKGINVAKLYRYSDAGGVEQLSDLRVGGSDYISVFAALNGKVYLSGGTGPNLANLFSYDGTNLVQISDVDSGAWDYISGAIVSNNKLYFGNVTNGTFVYDPVADKITSLWGVWSQPIIDYAGKVYSFQNLQTYIYDPAKNLSAKILNGRPLAYGVFGNMLYVVLQEGGGNSLYRICDPTVATCN